MNEGMSSMPEPLARSWHRTASEDLWERTLSQIGTQIGRLAYLARLRNPETERYEHHGLSAVFGEDVAEDALRRSHRETLVEWLTLTLEEQKRDMGVYLDGLPQSRRKLLQSWDRGQGYLNFLPAECSFGERVAFTSSCEVIVKSLRAGAAHHAAAASPGS
jgi:hypothetical protein